MVKLHKPAMLVFLETRMTEHKYLIQEMGFSSQIQKPTLGLSRGIVIMWRDDILKINVVFMVKVTPSYNPWIFTTIYDNNTYATRRILWEMLRLIPENYKCSWLVGGGVNEILKARDKQGGNCISSPRTNSSSSA